MLDPAMAAAFKRSIDKARAEIAELCRNIEARRGDVDAGAIANARRDAVTLFMWLECSIGERQCPSPAVPPLCGG